MNQQNMMQQFFDQQQGNVNGFPGAGYQPSQPMTSSSYANGPTSASSPFVGSASLRQQNGMSRYGITNSDSNESFDVQSPNTQTQQNFPNFMDPRMANFDPRTRPNFDPNGMMPGMESFDSNTSFPGKMRMNDMSSLFSNPAAMAAFQRQRMMFNQGRENDFMSPTNPFSGFNPQQAAQLMQQQRMAAVYQRQVQEQLAAQNSGNRPDSNRPPSTGRPPTVGTNGPKDIVSNFNQATTPHQNNIPNRPSSVAGSDISNQESQSLQPATSTTTATNAQLTDNQKKFPSNESIISMQKQAYEGTSDTQRNAAMVAAAAVRAAAIASVRGPRNTLQNTAGMNNYPYGPRGYPMSNEQMPSPFANQGIQSPDFGNVLSPNRDMPGNMMNVASPISQGRATPRSGNPPPYSPMPHSTESNHSSSGSVKGSLPNLVAAVNTNKSIEGATLQPRNQPQIKEEPFDNRNLNQKSSDTILENNHVNSNDSGSLMVAGSATKLSAPSTPISLSAASPAPSFQDDSSDALNLSPSWPQTPLSPNAQKILRARASPKQYEQLSKVYDLINDAQKKHFLERYLAFMSVNGTPVTKLPVIGKQPLDLYTLFRAVCERGGIQKVMENRLFREVLNCLNLPSGNSGLAYLVKSQYMKYLHAYELKNKDSLLAEWKNSVTKQNNKSRPGVPTIALNDSLPPSVNDTKVNMNHNTFQMSSNTSTPNWMPNSYPASMGNATITNAGGVNNAGQYPSRMPFGNQVSANQGLPPNYGQQGMPGYGGQDIPPGYPGFAGYPNAMYPHGPIQNFNSMHGGLPNDNKGGSWPRGFSPRQGPPELFPEGLQRMPYNHNSQRHLSAFGTPNYTSSGKPRGQMPPISRDQVQQQLKYSAQQQQLKLQQYQQQQQQQQRFNTPDVSKKEPVRPAAPDLKPNLTPTHAAKREFAFPPNCVEGTKPVLKKRKKLTSKDLGPVEAWRIMMSLKSGLVAECTWAIDTLNMLLADNNTITCFHLIQLPGLLDTLTDHYRRSLANLFSTFEELEISLFPETKQVNDGTCNTVDQKIAELWVGVCKNSKGSYSSNVAATAVTATMQEFLPGGKDNWESGGGDCTKHIRTSFPDKDVKLKSFPEYETITIKPTEDNRNDELVEVKSPMLTCVKIDSNATCLSVLQNLLDDFNTSSSKEPSDHPLVEKLLKDLEFSIPCDKKYLEDSKDFIEYLNRRLNSENRVNIQSDHSILKQSTPFIGTPESQKSLLNRCVALSNIFRSLSFIQGNDTELANHVGLLLVCGFILLHKHEHTHNEHSQIKLKLDEQSSTNSALPEQSNSLWWSSLYTMRENTLVLLANIGGHLNLARLKQNVHRPLVNGLLHWLVCRSSEALDPLPTAPGSHALSAQRLAMESLAKMTINNSNVGPVVSCPPESRLEEISEILVKQIARKYPVPTREFAIILMDNLASSEQFSKVLAMRRSAVSNLVKFVYEAEKNTSTYLSSGGRVQPGLNAEDICGTSISLLRRSVNILLSISKVPCNRRTLIPYTDDILALSTSQMIDTSVLALLAQVLFELTL